MNFDNELYLSNLRVFLNNLGNVEDGMAAQRVANDIVHFIKTGEKR